MECRSPDRLFYLTARLESGVPCSFLFICTAKLPIFFVFNQSRLDWIHLNIFRDFI